MQQDTRKRFSFKKIRKKKKTLKDKINILHLKYQASEAFLTKAPIKIFLRYECHLRKLNVKKV